MLNRIHRLLKPVCAALALLFVYQAARMLSSEDPLRGVVVPAIQSNSTATAVAAEPALISPVSGAPKAPQTTASPILPTRSPSESIPPGMHPRRPGAQPVQVDPAVQARIDRIKESEIFGALPRPLPMALLGIAGRDVFLRTATGQTGLVREGETFGGVRIVRISTNRVLVEHEGQQKELTIFSGFGSESLLSEGKEKRQ